MEEFLVNGIESVEVATLLPGGAIDQTSWVRIENIEDGSVSLTSNADTKTNIIPEDKDVAILVLYTPGDPDIYNFGMLEISPDNVARFWNVDYDPTTTTITKLAAKKYANLALRFTSRPQNGVKAIFTFPNTTSEATWKNNVTKNGLLTIAVAASIFPYKTISGKDALQTIQFVAADGTAINSVPPTVGAGADTTSSAATKSLTGTATAASPKTILMTQWTQVSGPNTAGFSAPNALTTNVTGLITGTYVFRLTGVDSVGATSKDEVTVVATVGP